MATAKITRFSLPKAKLLQFNPHGKSMPAPIPQRDEIAERFPSVREHCSAVDWPGVRSVIELVMEKDCVMGGGR